MACLLLNIKPCEEKCLINSHVVRQRSTAVISVRLLVWLALLTNAA